MDWPDWCYVPVSGAYAVVSGGGAQRVPFERAGHVGLVAGLGAWRITQGIYRFDPALYEALVATPITDEIPVDALHRLPGWCVYIETPGRTLSGVRLHGFFGFLEFDARTRRDELRLLLDLAADPREPFDPVRGVTSLPLPLVGGNLSAALQAMIRAGVVQAQQAGYGLTEDDMPPLADMAVDLAPLLSLLLYLCSAEPDIAGAAGGYLGADLLAPVRTRRHGPRYFGPDAPAAWDVGTRLGAALRAAYQREQMGADPAETGRHVRPHVRRAHWHTFVLGSRIDPAAQRRELRWLPPIPVAVSDFDSMPSVIHPVDP
ncbi:hypothetical protein B1A_11880 [mine drainage metagenome]|uniref:Uncharacterized protein n=3 Tax=mine drainage metagenome TaxID=410659 RepID=T1AG70_9ZZZZ